MLDLPRLPSRPENQPTNSGESSWRTERRIAVMPFDLPEVKKHTATGCPFVTFQVVEIPSLDVRKRSPLARRPSGFFVPRDRQPQRNAISFGPNIPAGRGHRSL